MQANNYDDDDDDDYYYLTTCDMNMIMMTCKCQFDDKNDDDVDLYYIIIIIIYTNAICMCISQIQQRNPYRNRIQPKKKRTQWEKIAQKREIKSQIFEK